MNYSIPIHNLDNGTDPKLSSLEVYLDNNVTFGTATVTDGGQNQNPGEIITSSLLKQSAPAVALFTVSYGIVLILAVLNNAMVVLAIQKNQHLKTVTNMFVANLAIADIMVSLLVLPITLLENLFTEWKFGIFMCRATPYLQALAVGASGNTLAAVAVERYLAIFHAGTMSIRPNQVIVVIVVIWVVPACAAIPWAVFSRTEDFLVNPKHNIVWTLCYQLWPSTSFDKGFFLGVVFLTCYLIPLCFLAVFYALIGVKVWQRSVAGIKGSKAEKNINKSKIRIVRMLIVVTATFALSWLPLYSIRLYTLFGPQLTTAQKHLLRDTVIPIAQWLGSANNCVNPFIYCYFSEHFRKAIINLCRSCWGFQRSCGCFQRLSLDQDSAQTQTTRVVVADGDAKNNVKRTSVIVDNTVHNGNSV